MTTYPRTLSAAPWHWTRKVIAQPVRGKGRRMYLGSPLVLLVLLYAVIVALMLKYSVVFYMAVLAAVWSALVTIGWAATSAFVSVRHAINR